MKLLLLSEPDCRIHPPVTVGKAYEFIKHLGNATVVMSDNMEDMVAILSTRFMEKV